LSYTIKARGIIIKEVPVSESDKYLTIFTKDIGKIVVRAKGAKNSKSKFVISEIFSYVDFVFYKGNNFNSLTQIELIENFYNIRLNYDILMSAYEIAKIIDKYIQGVIDEEESNNILLLSIISFKALSKNYINHDLIFCIFSIKFLQLTGFEPYIYGNRIQSTVSEILITNDIKNSIHYILTSEIKKIYNFTIDEKNIREFKKICTILLSNLEI